MTAAGHIRHDQLVALITRYARHFPPGQRPRFQPAPHDQDQPRLRLFTKDIEQTQMALGIRTCSRHDDRRYALRLLNTLLGENMSSRLFQIVREDRGLAYSIGSSLGFFDDVGLLAISAGLDTDNLPQTLKLVLRELRHFTTHLPSVSELRRARDYLLGQMDLSLENTANQMMWIGEQLLGYGKIIPPTQIKQRLAEVKPNEIRAVAREFFRPERLSLALVSPLKTETSIRPLLKL